MTNNRKTLLNNAIWKVISLFILILIFINSNTPVEEGNQIFAIPHLDKLLHILAWIGLSFSLRLGFEDYLSDNNLGLNYNLLLIIIVSITYGIVDEIHQYFVPTRVMDIYDILADSIGSIIGAFFGQIFIIKVKKTTLE